MGKKLPPEQLELYKRIDEILFYKWDPIGVSEIAWPRDEYQSYLPKVFTMAIESSDPGVIAQFLNKIATEHMGLDSNLEHDLAAAQLVIAVKEKCIS